MLPDAAQAPATKRRLSVLQDAVQAPGAKRPKTCSVLANSFTFGAYPVCGKEYQDMDSALEAHGTTKR